MLVNVLKVTEQKFEPKCSDFKAYSIESEDVVSLFFNTSF